MWLNIFPIQRILLLNGGNMLLYFENIDEAIESTDISRIWPWSPENSTEVDWNGVIDQLENGIEFRDIVNITENVLKSTIKLRNGDIIHTTVAVKDIIEIIRKNNVRNI